MERKTPKYSQDLSLSQGWEPDIKLNDLIYDLPQRTRSLLQEIESAKRRKVQPPNTNLGPKRVKLKK